MAERTCTITSWLLLDGEAARVTGTSAKETLDLDPSLARRAGIMKGLLSTHGCWEGEHVTTVPNGADTDEGVSDMERDFASGAETCISVSRKHGSVQFTELHTK